MALSLAACGTQKRETLELFAMDTYMTFVAIGDGADDVLTDLSRTVNTLESSLSRTVDTSEVSRLNRDGSAVWDEDGAQLLSWALQHSQETDGAFDITIAPLVELWGITSDSPRVPSQAEIDALLPLVGYEHVHQSEFCSISLDEGCSVDLGGIAKGSGMIHPNMATMLVFLTTDAAISPAMLQSALSADVQDSFNMISVDGDTSTNDMVSILANGLAGNAMIEAPGSDYDAFCTALAAVTKHLCRTIAKDGEGASKLLTCRVTGAKDRDAARTVAKSVICSSLFKAAMFGADANWGRVLCAIGYSGADVDVDGVSVRFASAAGSITVCERGRGVPFSEPLAKTILSEAEIDVLIGLTDGASSAEAWGCDLTYDYVKINGDYRT